MDRYLPIGLRPKKRFGQNFLVDEKVVADLVAAAKISKEDVVVEVGAGTGVLTRELARRAGKVFAFELDRDLIPVLQKNLQEFDNVKIVNQDFLTSDSSLMLCKNPSLRSGTLHFSLRSKSSVRELTQFKIVGSIPYQITSPLIHKLLTFDPRPSLVVLLIQKEVAEKITARPPKATYLSNIVKLLGDVEVVQSVPKTAFFPVPEVDGAIVKINCSRGACPAPSFDIENFQKFLHRGFQNPRKMLRTRFDSEVLKSAGIDPTQRAQRLSLEKWLSLYSS